MSPEAAFLPWAYGVALKYKRRLLLLWPGSVESCLIDGVNWLQQLHICVQSPIAGAATPGPSTAYIVTLVSPNLR